jgi:anion-transporting  ArsA/GET3 family ATPase
VPLVGRIGPLAHTFDFVADAAPGVKEILSVGKLAYEARERHSDLVVVDAEASGHIVGQISAPTVIADLVKVGLVRDQTAWMTAILEDSSRTGVVVVTTPEEMPVTETIELLDRLGEETNVAPATVVVNRVLPAFFDRRQQAVMDRIEDALPQLVEHAGTAITTVVRAAELTETRRRIGAGHLDRLRDAVPKGLPLVYIPELFTRATGRRVVTLVATALGEELETGH